MLILTFLGNFLTTHLLFITLFFLFLDLCVFHLYTYQHDKPNAGSIISHKMIVLYVPQKKQ